MVFIQCYFPIIVGRNYSLGSKIFIKLVTPKLNVFHFLFIKPGKMKCTSMKQNKDTKMIIGDKLRVRILVGMS